MKLSANTKSKLKTVFYVTLTACIIGPLFVSIAFGFTPDRILKGFIAGFLIASIGSSFEAFVFQNKFKKLPFSVLVIIKTFFYVLVISFAVILVWVVHESGLNHRSWLETIKTDDFSHFLVQGDFKYILIFAILVSLLNNFFVQLNYLLGKGVLLSYITGKYHNPLAEERIVMFLDLESSTTIAEKLGMLKYHKFMNNYFFDINDPIMESKGEIYQYVGDEVVISWTKKNGIKNLNCIDCFFRIRDKILALRENYEKEFGYVPGFKAGLHCGELVVGEVGDAKKEIVFHGDVMNTCSRIQNQAKTLNLPILISEDQVKILLIAYPPFAKGGQGGLLLNDKYKIEPMGTFKLKGKAQELNLYSVSSS